MKNISESIFFIFKRFGRSDVAVVRLELRLDTLLYRTVHDTLFSRPLDQLITLKSV